ncbi:hypothetical protein [Rhodovibrio salinarum]|uniref:hypothetical protein n=1 Tax=Rhodovibrio salinarum TaxID=1087 RepID=UPI001F5BB399|nr:hypothetical protein [Rhodovibrio salinarum]
MAEQGDLDELARRYLDLWQDQMTALANDPDMAEATEQMLRLMGFAPPDGETSAHAGTGNGNPWANAQAWQQAVQANALAGAQATGQQASAAWGWPMAMMAALTQGAQQMPSGWPGQGGVPPGWPPYGGGPQAGWTPPGAAGHWPGQGWMPPMGWGAPPGYGPPPGWGSPTSAPPANGYSDTGHSDTTGAGHTGSPGAQGSADDRQGNRGHGEQRDARPRDERPERAASRAGDGRPDCGRDDGHGGARSQRDAHGHVDNGAARPAAGSTAAAGPSGSGDLDLDEFASRLARLEERLAALEGPGKRGPDDDTGSGQQSGGKTGKSAPRNRKRGS